MNIMGIYKITNTVDNKFYIGSAHNIAVRWNTHKRELKSNSHDNKYLQSIWNKFGEENFIFEIIEIVEYEKNLLDVEQEWLDKTQCYNPEIGYNLSCITRGSNVKHNIIRQNIIDIILQEPIPLYYEENVTERITNASNKIMPMISNLNGLFKKLYEFYKDNIRNQTLSNCSIYTNTINFDLKNIIESKTNIEDFLYKYEIEMIRIEDYCHNSNAINIYKNTFVWFNIENNILTLQSHYRNDEIQIIKKM